VSLWLPREIQMLRDAYTNATLNRDIALDDLARKLGRHKSNVSRKARSLGLTNKTRKSVEAWKDRRMFKGDAAALAAHKSVAHKAWIAEHGHVRGMLGKTHSQETKNHLRETSLAARSKITDEEASAIAMKAMKTRVERYGSAAPNVERGSWKAGWREIGGYRKFYRSRWEANYARYLQWLKERGEIQDWKHEPETFWFEAIKRGVRSYLPDFRVWENNGETPLHEVKGWMDDRSKTVLKRMAKYHPDQRIIVIREQAYNAIARTAGPMIDGWEKSERSGRW